MLQLNDLIPQSTLCSNIAYSYLRLSSDRQIRGDGRRRQLEETAAYVAELGLTLDESLEDIGVSGFTGANRERGALGRFLGMVRNGKIPRGSHLIVESLDRLSRDKVMKAFRVFSDILEAGIILHTYADRKIYTEASVNENASELIISITIMLRGNEESRMKQKRQRSTWEQKRKNASERKLSMRVPHWLNANRDPKTGLISIEPRPERAAIVTRMFEELAQGIGRDKIARRLNAEGVKPFGHGRQWHGGCVQKITDSHAVLGWFQPGRTIAVEVSGEIKNKRVPDGEIIKDYYPRIIGDELWIRARKAAESRKQTKASNTGGRKGTIYSNLFSGFTRCAECGNPLNYRDRGPRSTPVLRCSGERNGACGNTYKYRYQPLEDAVLDWLEGGLNLDEVVPEEISKLEGEVGTKTLSRDSLLREGEAIMAEFGREGSRLAAARIRTLEEAIAMVEEEIRELQRQISDIKGKMGSDERKRAVELLRESMAAAQNDAERYSIRARVAQALREVASAMTFERNGNVHVTVFGTDLTYTFKEGSLAGFKWSKSGADQSIPTFQLPSFETQRRIVGLLDRKRPWES